MPIYDYRCDSCGEGFEAQRSVAARHTAGCGCGGVGGLVIVRAPSLDPRMGVDPDFATMARRWDKKHAKLASGKMKDANETAYGTDHDHARPQ